MQYTGVFYPAAAFLEIVYFQSRQGANGKVISIIGCLQYPIPRKSSTIFIVLQCKFPAMGYYRDRIQTLPSHMEAEVFVGYTRPYHQPCTGATFDRCHPFPVKYAEGYNADVVHSLHNTAQSAVQGHVEQGVHQSARAYMEYIVP